MSKYEDQWDDGMARCPYCLEEYQPEAEDYSEDDQIEECGNCGKKYHLQQDFSVSHTTQPDCELNGLDHTWVPKQLRGGGTHDFCDICDTCRPIERTP